MTDNKSTDTIQLPWKHSLAARRLFIPGEDESVFNENYTEFMKTLKPDGIVEFDLVEQMCIALWLKDRAIRMQTLAFEKLEPGEIPKDLRLFMRYQTTNEDLYFRALRTFQAIQKQKIEEDRFAARQRFTPDLNHPMERRKTPEPIGFVSPVVQDCAQNAQKPKILHNGPMNHGKAGFYRTNPLCSVCTIQNPAQSGGLQPPSTSKNAFAA